MASLRMAMCLGLGMVLGTEVPTNAPLMSVGLDSIAAVEFTNAVSDELGMTFSAIMLFDHPTLDSIASYLMVELETGSAVAAGSMSFMERAHVVSRESGIGYGPEVLLSIMAGCFRVAGSTSSEAALRRLVSRGQATPSSVPIARWVAAARDAAASAAYGSFLDIEGLALDGRAFEISVLEVRSMDP